jgi:hypothetical protein
LFRNSSTEFKQQLSTDGMEEMVPVEVTRELFDLDHRHLCPAR